MRKYVVAILSVLLMFLTLSSNETYAAESTWVPKANLLEKKDRISLVNVDGKIYSIGGNLRNYGLDEYDPATNVWVRKSNLPQVAVQSAGVAVLAGKIYIVGGVTHSGVSKRLDVYDPRTNVWETKADLPITLAGHSVEVVNGKILALGGFNYYNNAVTTVYEYDPKANNWSEKAPMSVSRRYTSSTVVDGKIYMMGGMNDSTGVLASVEEYDPVKNTWAKKTDMPVAANGVGAITFNNEIYVIGGTTAVASASGPSTAKVNKYNPKTNIWTPVTDLSVSRGALGVTNLGGKIYAAGGSQNGTLYDTFEMLDLSSTLPPVEEPTIPPITEQPPIEEPSTPEQPAGERAILVVTMVNGLEKEYDLSVSEVNSFANWYDSKSAGTGSARFIIDKHSNNKGPFSKRTDSIIFNNILTFEISEYKII